MHVFTCLFDTLTYSLRNLIRFAEPIANLTVTVSNDDYGAKTKSSTAFNDFSYPVDKNYFFDELFLNPFFRSFKFSQETPPFDIFNRLKLF